LVCNNSNAPPVCCLQQFNLRATAAVSHFNNFFTLSCIFTKVSKNIKFVAWTMFFHFLHQVYMEHSYVW
jgi:hypothetical protein